MFTAMLTVQNIADGTAHDVWAVNVEEDYHEEISPVAVPDGPAATRTLRRRARAPRGIQRRLTNAPFVSYLVTLPDVASPPAIEPPDRIRLPSPTALPVPAAAWRAWGRSVGDLLWYGFLAVVLTASVVLRFVAVSPLWLDEAQSAAIARLPLTAPTRRCSRRCARTARRRCTTSSCTGGSASSATAREPSGHCRVC